MEAVTPPLVRDAQHSPAKEGCSVLRLSIQTQKDEAATPAPVEPFPGSERGLNELFEQYYYWLRFWGLLEKTIYRRIDTLFALAGAMRAETLGEFRPEACCRYLEFLCNAPSVSPRVICDYARSVRYFGAFLAFSGLHLTNMYAVIDFTYLKGHGVLRRLVLAPEAEKVLLYASKVRPLFEWLEQNRREYTPGIRLPLSQGDAYYIWQTAMRLMPEASFTRLAFKGATTSMYYQTMLLTGMTPAQMAEYPVRGYYRTKGQFSVSRNIIPPATIPITLPLEYTKDLAHWLEQRRHMRFGRYSSQGMGKLDYQVLPGDEDDPLFPPLHGLAGELHRDLRLLGIVHRSGGMRLVDLKSLQRSVFCSACAYGTIDVMDARGYTCRSGSGKVSFG